MTKRIGIIATLSLMYIIVLGQVSNSPFTQYGVGDVYGSHQANSFGMGGVGISNADVRYLNNQNPALLIYNSIYTYTVGITGESRSTYDDNLSQKTSGANLSYLGMSFPIKPNRWVSSLILTPYSNINYLFKNTIKLSDGTQYFKRLKGEKGLVQLEWSHGFKIKEYLSVGAKIKYLFGTINRESANALTSIGVNRLNQPTTLTRDAASDIMLGFGVHYKYEIKKNTNLNLGLIFEPKSNVNIKRLRTFERRTRTNLTQTADTLMNNVKGNITIPSTIGIGASVGSPLKWTVALDVRLQQWNSYRDYDGNNDGLQNTFSIAVGGEYTPDAGSVNNLLKRVTYRLGASYEKTPYVINDSGVDDFGINFGTSIPIAGISSLDMGFRFGKRGNISSNKINENYFRLQVGMTFNDRLWFIKRKFD